VTEHQKLRGQDFEFFGLSAVLCRLSHCYFSRW